MPVTKVGIVYYADDPEKKVFRLVYPSKDDSELDGPVTDNNGKRLIDDHGRDQWHTFHVDPNRKAVMEKVARDDPRVALTGTV